MEEEIISLNQPLYKENDKIWCNVAITIEGLSQINGIIIGDETDPNSQQEKIRKQMHKDCLKLFKEFKSDQVLQGKK